MSKNLLSSVQAAIMRIIRDSSHKAGRRGRKDREEFIPEDYVNALFD